MPQAQFPCGLVMKVKLGKHEQLGVVQRGNISENCRACEKGLHVQKDWVVCNGRVINSEHSEHKYSQKQVG